MSERVVPLDHFSASSANQGRLFLPGSAVAVNGNGVVFCGRSGAGKSGACLQMMAHGAELVCDDGVWVHAEQDALWVHRPKTAPPLIEARQIGLVPCGPVRMQARLHLVVDLDYREHNRLPANRIARFAGCDVGLIYGAGVPNLVPTILLMLRHGRGTP
jgi:HPr kinase/phosphorylase